MVRKTSSTRRRGQSGGPRQQNTPASTTTAATKSAAKSAATPVEEPPFRAATRSRRTKANEKRDPPPNDALRASSPTLKPTGNRIKLPKEGSTYAPEGSTTSNREDKEHNLNDSKRATQSQVEYSGIGNRRRRVRKVKPVRIIPQGSTSIEIIEDCIKDIDCSGVIELAFKSAGELMAFCADEVQPMAKKMIAESANCAKEASNHAEKENLSLPFKQRANCAVTKQILSLPVEDCRIPQKNEKEVVPLDLWSYYRGTCGSLTTKWKYDDTFRRLKRDPLYPYLYMCSGVNDIAHGGAKKLVQVCGPGDVYSSLLEKAKEAQPQLIDICKTLAKRLKLSKIGVGPLKEKSAAIAKAARKYEGNLCNITDYCRAFVVCFDIASLLALLEYVCEHFGPAVCRIKLSLLKGDPLPGGYRHCNINLMVKGHIVEIQVHLSPLYSICDVAGYQHYHDCVVNNTDVFKDPLDVLHGLDEKTVGEMAQVAGEDIKVTSVENISWDDEEKIVDYFAIAGLLLRHEESFKAEVILRKLIDLRTSRDHTPHMESNHPEAIHLRKSLEVALRQQNLIEEADFVREQREEDVADDKESFFDSDSIAGLGMFHVKARGSKEDEKKRNEQAKLSRDRWSKTRRQRFSFMSSYSVAEIALAEINCRLDSSAAAKLKTRQSKVIVATGARNPGAETFTDARSRSTTLPVTRSTKGLKGS